MRKTSQEFNSDIVIENIAFLCKESDLKELFMKTKFTCQSSRAKFNGIVCVFMVR